jgi:hypothetical protein
VTRLQNQLNSFAENPMSSRASLGTDNAAPSNHKLEGHASVCPALPLVMPIMLA